MDEKKPILVCNEICCHNQKCRFQCREECHAEAIWIGPDGKCFSGDEEVTKTGGDQNLQGNNIC